MAAALIAVRAVVSYLSAISELMNYVDYFINQGHAYWMTNKLEFNSVLLSIIRPQAAAYQLQVPQVMQRSLEWLNKRRQRPAVLVLVLANHLHHHHPHQNQLRLQLLVLERMWIHPQSFSRRPKAHVSIANTAILFFLYLINFLIEIGPGASKDKEYKNPEYFLYHTMSFCDMEEVMAKFRLPQPSSLKK
jgi:hypothetical protein